MGSHSRFSPSATEREYTCPGSFLLNEMMPDRQSPDAAHGTAAHHVGELCLRANLDVDTYAGCTIAVDAKGKCRFVHESAPLLDEIEMGFEVDDEMVVAVQEYVDWCRALPGEHFVEVRVEHTNWCPDTDEFGMPLDPQFGTADHIACVSACVEYPEPTIVVTDLKYGKGVKVFAKENKQAIKYALGAWKLHDWEYGFKHVVIRIAQPRLGHFDEWELTVAELLEWGENIKRRLELVFVEDPPFEATEKGCKFCKVAPTCTHLHTHLRNIYAMQFDDLTGEPTHDPRLLTDEELLKAYYAIPLYQLAGDAVQAEMHRRLRHGEPCGRLKLVAAHTHRTWKDEAEVREFLRSKGIDDSKAVTRTLVSPAQAEKLLPKAAWEELGDLWVRPPGKPCIVDETDPRPSYRDSALLEHFDEVDEHGF